jgi:ubiquinone/menaquinone biosynthesis C-methylase UbiE
MNNEQSTVRRTLSTNADFAPAEMNLHLDQLRRNHFELYECVDVERAMNWAREFMGIHLVDHFGRESGGGRGGSYVRAQAHNLTARAHGIEQLLGLIRNGTDATHKKVVDVLGGDGLVRRVAASLGLSDLAVLTCDLSPYMVRAAWSSDCPALLQRADHLLQRDGSVDGVLVAYGSHHIAPADRLNLAREAYRVLRPGGVLVLHDFLARSPMCEWFDQVVDRYSETGHQFEHFTREEMLGYLTSAGFESYEVIDLADPYVATAVTPAEAELGLGRYLLDMYGLVEIERIHDGTAERWAIERARTIFRYPGEQDHLSQLSVRYDEDAKTWRCTVPRMAIVGVGRKAR